MARRTWGGTLRANSQRRRRRRRVHGRAHVGGYTTGKQSEEKEEEEVGAHNHIEIADTARPSNTAA